MCHFIFIQQNYLWLIRGLLLIFSLSLSLLSFANKSSTKSQIQTGDELGVKSHVEATRMYAKAPVLLACRTKSEYLKELASIMDSLFDPFSLSPDYERLENKNSTISKSANVYFVKEVTGTLTDEKGDPLPGVTVAVKGTNRGTNTDIDGKYNLSVEDNAILVFSFVGYRTQEIIVGAQLSIDVQLVAEQKQLEEVVVIGYGTQKKVNLTGAVAYVDAATLEKRVSPPTMTLLQGQLPGLQVVQGSGQPGGGGIQLQIRGMGSFGSSNDPLILVDGIPGPMPTVENVASVSLLKDAASAAMQMVRGRPGVNLPPLSASLNKEQMRTKIQNEQRVELAYEGGNRYFDLMRWKMMGEIIPKIIDPNGIRRVWYDYNYLWPFPTSALTRNPKLVQNPGYPKL